MDIVAVDAAVVDRPRADNGYVDDREGAGGAGDIWNLSFLSLRGAAVGASLSTVDRAPGGDSVARGKSSSEVPADSAVGVVSCSSKGSTTDCREGLNLSLMEKAQKMRSEYITPLTFLPQDANLESPAEETTWPVGLN